MSFTVSDQINLATVDDECFKCYEDMQHYKTTIKYVIFGLNEDETLLRVEKIGKDESTYNDFAEELSQHLNDPKWALLNFEYKTTSGGKRKKLTFVSWVPDTISRETMKETIRVKTSGILYQGALKKSMRGVVCNIQTNHKDDLDKFEVLSRVARHERDEIDRHSIMN